MSLYRIEDLIVNLDDDGERDETLHSSIAWRSHGFDLPSIEGGTDEGSLLVRFMVDGQFDGVYADLGQTGQIQGLERAIDTLTTLRDHLAQLYRGDEPEGRCLNHGDTGRCIRRAWHDVDHDFPNLPRPRRTEMEKP